MINIASEASKVLLIDLENCPSQLQDLPQDLENYLQVVICYAQSTSKVPLNWLTPLAAAISADKLKIQKMERAGKNSADFGICFFAGSLMQALPKETHFVIVSNDTDLDHTIHLLKSHGRTSERVGTKKEEKEPQKVSLQSTSENPVSLYCMHLVAYSKNRPGKIETLKNSIKNKFKENPSLADLVYKELVSSGAIKVSENKLVYNDKKIKELSCN